MKRDLKFRFAILGALIWIVLSLMLFAGLEEMCAGPQECHARDARFPIEIGVVIVGAAAILFFGSRWARR